MTTPAAALCDVAKPLTIQWRGRTVNLKYLSWVDVLLQLEDWIWERMCDKNTVSLNSLLKAGIISRDELIEKQQEFSNGAHKKNLAGFGSEAMMGILTIGADGKTGSQTPASPHFAGLLKFITLMTDLSADDAVSLLNDKEKQAELSQKLAMVMTRSFPDVPEQETVGAK